MTTTTSEANAQVMPETGEKRCSAQVCPGTWAVQPIQSDLEKAMQ